MNIEQKIIAARPNDATSDKQFTNAVRAKITKIQPKRRRFSFAPMLRRRPAATLLIIFATIALLSGTVYAVSYLWPQLNPSVSDPQKSASGRESVIVTDCDKADSRKRYELKSGAPVAADKMSDVVKAQCEIDALAEWSMLAYPNERRELKDYSTPGLVIDHITNMPPSFVDRLIQINLDSLTVMDGSTLTERSVNISPDTKYIINGRYAQQSQLAAGDAIAYVSQDTRKLQNQMDCNDIHCSADILSSTEKILVVIKMKYSFDVYQSIRYLNERPVCAGNPADECPSVSSIDIYQRFAEAESNEMEWAEITGKVSAFNDQSIVISTTSGRKVVAYTPWNLIGSFNTEKSSGYGHAIGIGDTLSIMYNQPKGTTNASEIPWEQLTWVKLLLEADSKAGPFNKY